MKKELNSLQEKYQDTYLKNNYRHNIRVHGNLWMEYILAADHLESIFSL